MTPADLAGLDREAFLAAFGDVFEHSPWVAEGAWKRAPFRSLDSLLAAMLQVLHEAGEERQLALVRAHPDLAGKAAIRGELTAASGEEQARSGLSSLTPAEFARFQELNDAYKAKFGFPFIMAVRHSNKVAILNGFEERLVNTREAELERALSEIGKIARFRLEALIAEG
jgi:2-oxo-4-hydroxy-4-carboxy-5-ureidoimidazoline decarboxylase